MRLYTAGAVIVAIPTFLIAYAFCIATSGFLLGGAVGWIPAAIVAFIAGALWPVGALIVGLGVMAWNGSFSQKPAAAVSQVALTPSDLNSFRSQFQRCWKPETETAVTVRLKFGQDGNLSGEPALVGDAHTAQYQRAAQAVINAVKACQPYKLPASAYAAWKDVEATFDPHDGSSANAR